MKNKFWVTAIGRSGTNKIADLLAKASGHTVRHEDADPRHPSIAHPFVRFPIERFLGDDPYGECHGFFRYNLSPYHAGTERTMPRAIIYRDLRKVITAWMNHDGRHRLEFGAVAYEVSEQWFRLEWYSDSDPGCRIFELEKLVSDLPYLQSFLDHLEIPATATIDLFEGILNATPDHMKEFKWNVDAEFIFRQINSRLWLPRGINSKYVKYHG